MEKTPKNIAPEKESAPPDQGPPEPDPNLMVTVERTRQLSESQRKKSAEAEKKQDRQ